MGGPAATVVLPRAWSEDDGVAFSEEIGVVLVRGGPADFYIVAQPVGAKPSSPLPFFCEICALNDDPEVDADTYAPQFEVAFGFFPVDIITLVAMVSGGESHRVLGEPCLWVAERCAGVVDFGGPLLPRSARTWTQPADPTVRDQLVATMPGRVAAIGYETANGTTAATHAGDAEFMRAWLAHPDFHMVK